MTDCAIKDCSYEATKVVPTFLINWEGDVLDDEGQPILEQFDVCDGHAEMLEQEGYQIGASGYVEERVLDRKPADWCKICDGPCKVGMPGAPSAHRG